MFLSFYKNSLYPYCHFIMSICIFDFIQDASGESDTDSSSLLLIPSNMTPMPKICWIHLLLLMTYVFTLLDKFHCIYLLNIYTVNLYFQFYLGWQRRRWQQSSVRFISHAMQIEILKYLAYILAYMLYIEPKRQGDPLFNNLWVSTHFLPIDSIIK